MKLLLCCPSPWVDPKDGASRVGIDFSIGLKANGVNHTFYPPPDNEIYRLDYPTILADHLIEHAHEYEVVDYPFHVKPWIKDAKGSLSKTLTIARVVLLPHHEDFTPDPSPTPTLKSRAKQTVKTLLGKKGPVLYSNEIRLLMDQNMREADLISVANTQDKTCLVKLGFESEKIMILPYGLTEERFKALAPPKLQSSEDGPIPRIAFIGSFDYRKGCIDFPDIVEHVAQSIPDVKFRLLGTKGMMQTEEKVRRSFPKKLQKHLEIYPTFDPEQLASLLWECRVGMFPSYREGFGIAVVEMLGAGLPVIAYDAAGPCDILPEDWLVQPGEKESLANKLISIIRDPDPASNVDWALNRSHEFDWNQIALDSLEIYQQQHLSKCKGGAL